MSFDSTLYFITDSTVASGDRFYETVEGALRGGVDLLQLREKECSTREYIERGKRVHELTRKYDVPLIIDDRIDVALAVGAEGVHLGRRDLPIDIARDIAGDDLIIGASTKTVEQARKAYEQGADYLGVGAIFPTTTKVITIRTSVETLEEICRAVPIPVNAIGGLNKDNIDVLKDADIAGVCVVSAIMKADDPEEAARTLRRRTVEMLKRRG